MGSSVVSDARQSSTSETIQVPLLSDRDEQAILAQLRLEGINPGASNKGATIVNITNTVMGAGILVLPLAMKEGSIIPTLVLLVVTALIGVYTNYVIGKSCEITQQFTFRRLWATAFGTEYQYLMNILLALFTFSPLLGFSILVGNFMNSVFEEWAPGSVLENKWFVVLILLTLIALPLSLLKDLHSLRHVSVLAIVAIVYTMIIVVVSSVRAATGPTGWSDDVTWFKFDLGMFRAIGIMNFAFAMHPNSPKFYIELSPRSPKIFASTAFWASAICWSMYTIVAFMGYLEYGNEGINDDILTVSGKGVEFMIARLVMATVLLLTFPLIYNATRQNIDELFFEPPFTPTRNVLITICTTFTAAIIGLLYPKVGVVMSLSGTILGSLAIFIVPHLIYLVVGKNLTQNERMAPIACITYGVLTGLAGSYANIEDIIDNL